MQAEQSILDRIQRRQLKWFSRVLKMEDNRWTKKIYQWTPHGRRSGRPQKSWKKPNDGLREKQKHGRRYGRRWTSLAFWSGWTVLGSILLLLIIIIIIIIIIINLLLTFSRGANRDDKRDIKRM